MGYDDTSMDQIRESWPEAAAPPTLSKADLLAERLPSEPFTIAGLGCVRIRPLSRLEALEIYGVEMPKMDLERRVLALAMVDPVMTQDDVRKWQRACPAGELQPLIKRVLSISGMEDGSPKEAVKEFRGEPGA